MEYKFKQKFGFNVFNLQPEELFDYAQAHGLRHIEINLSREHIALESFDDNRIHKLKSLSKLHNIQLSFHIPYFINISDILLHLRISNTKYLKKCILMAHAIEATHLTLHVGSFYWFPVEQWERKKALKRFVKSLGKILNSCGDKCVIIALENVVPIPRGSEYYLLGDNIEDFKYIFSNMNSKYVKFCLDTGHANMAEGVLSYVDNFNDKLVSIHYHDNNGSNDAHLPVGEGNVPWDALAKKLKKCHYSGPIISECRNIKAHKSAMIFENYFNEADSK